MNATAKSAPNRNLKKFDRVMILPSTNNRSSLRRRLELLSAFYQIGLMRSAVGCNPVNSHPINSRASHRDVPALYNTRHSIKFRCRVVQGGRIGRG
jgi:hypothetical protein